MSKETVTYLIKLKNAHYDLYIRNRPVTPEDTEYTRDKRRAREFDGLDKNAIDMTLHTAVKKTVTEQIEYEEIEFDD